MEFIRHRIHLCEYCCLSHLGNDAGWRTYNILPAGVGFSNRQPSPLYSEEVCQWMLSTVLKKKKREALPTTKVFSSKLGCSKNCSVEGFTTLAVSVIWCFEGE